MHEQPNKKTTIIMDWFLRDPRGPQWKQGWRGQVLASISLPPAPLLAVFAIVVLFLSLSWYTNYKEQVHRSELGLRFFFILFLFLVVLVLAGYMLVDRRFKFRRFGPEQEGRDMAGSSPWGVAALVVVLLLMVSYQSSFHSQWFRPLWRYT
ncbi:uncharacterized protein LOC120258934 [Dioscorea cayenensis subsp. rotundata]|uniref:Uncharacterized protein LOC120258934 n=1 Tax=Dioscorea cayennensis subsp. rotundata TaxID=55577 RepID=A0AB40B5N7_DIOCR|nr:uncharacterized protein LOC120258934 [Dioscorea cayenensis subsp. rotundata]